MPAFRSFVPAKRSPPYSLPLFARLDSVPTAPVSSPRACRNRPLPHCTKPLAAPPLALQSVSAAPPFPPASASPHSASSTESESAVRSASAVYACPTRQRKRNSFPSSISHITPWHSGHANAEGLPFLSLFA